MSDVISVQRRMSQLDVSPQFDSYSKVVIHVSDDVTYEWGTNTGRTLEFDNPFGSLQMCKDILARLQGYQYQPYEADGALLDPAAEIGDAMNSPLAYGGIYTRSKTFGRLMKADISAPQDEEIDHEYKFETPEQREFKRETSELRASLMVANNAITAEVEARTAQGETFASQLSAQATQIAAKVNQTGGNNSSFGWTLTASGFSLYSGNTEVMKCDKNGLTVKGNIAGSTGTIGGFTISSTALYTNNMSSMSSTQTTGVHLSASGIKLGQNFSVDSGGNVTATRLTVDTLYIGGTAVSASTLNSRANSAYTSTSSGGYCYNAAAGWNSVATARSGSYLLSCADLNATYSVNAAGFIVTGTNVSLGAHSHKMSVNSSGKVTILEPQNDYGSFNIADTAFYKNGVSAAYNNGYNAGYSAGGVGVVVNWNQYETYIYSMGTNSAYVRIGLTNGNAQFGWIYTR